ncbi:MAG: WG repeat-containing protein, partial [Candidatus Moranbacteria bacterium]|nr:WG repeat-containing protein [Candidatus Moranbacteria bacterium]
FQVGLSQVGNRNPSWPSSFKAGFINKEGELVVPFKYDDAGWFYDGLARVKLGDKWGFIDQKGQEVIEPKFESVRDFENGWAKAWLGNKEGIIDKQGSHVIPIVYDSVDEFQFFFDEVTDEFFSLARVKNDGLYGFLDFEGNIVVPIQYGYIGDLTSPGFSEGLVQVMKNYKWGFIDGHGNVIVELIYDKVSPFSSGRARVTQGRQTFDIDRTGARVNREKRY